MEEEKSSYITKSSVSHQMRTFHTSIAGVGDMSVICAIPNIKSSFSKGSPLQVDPALDRYAEWYSRRYEEYVSRTIHGFGTGSKFHSDGTC